MIKQFLSTLAVGLGLTSPVYPSSTLAHLGQMPSVAHRSPSLDRSLNVLQRRIREEARECTSNAAGMGASGRYDVTLKKTIESSKAIVLEVAATTMCDRVHSSSYRYAIAFEITTGKRIDLNKIYDIGIRQYGRVFLRPELRAPVIESYRKVNAGNPICLSKSDVEDGLLNYPMTISPSLEGGLALYYSAPDVEAACFPILKIDDQHVMSYRDASLANKYDLP
jgi:hypothetical protein